MIYFSNVFDNVFSFQYIFFLHKSNISSAYPASVHLSKSTREIPEPCVFNVNNTDTNTTTSFRFASGRYPEILGKLRFKKSWENCNYSSHSKAV